MSAFPGSPKVVKGALHGFDGANPVASVIVFQYNPEKLRRSLQPQTAGDGAGGARSEVQRLVGAPTETITLEELDIDAADQLERGDAQTLQVGIHPQLAALEMLLYPKSSQVIANTALMLAGSLEVTPPEAPHTLFVWGAKRVVPVRVEGFTIEEQEFDPALNPIRAKVSGLALRVLSYNDFSVQHPGFYQFIAHQAEKERLATLGRVVNQ